MHYSEQDSNAFTRAFNARNHASKEIFNNGGPNAERANPTHAKDSWGLEQHSPSFFFRIGLREVPQSSDAVDAL